QAIKVLVRATLGMIGPFWSAAACRRFLPPPKSGGKPPHSKLGPSTGRVLLIIDGTTCTIPRRPVRENPVTEPTPRILVLGAHPDDADIKAGGTAALWRDAGFVVKLVSLTDGRMGHHLTPGPAMAARRRDEARAAGAIIGAEYEVLDIPDGTLDDR